MYDAIGGIKAYFSEAIFSNEGVTKLEKVLLTSHSFLIHTKHKVNSGMLKHFKTDDYAE